MSLFFVAKQGFGQDSVLIDSHFRDQNLNREIFYFSIDAKLSQRQKANILNGKLNDKFIKNEKFVLILGFPDGREHWLRIDYINESNQVLYLESTEATSPSISEVYIRQADGNVEQIKGIQRDPNLIRTHFYFPMKAQKGSIYIRMVPDDFSIAIAQFSIKSVESILHKNKDLVFICMAYGLVLSLIIYNIVLAFNTKESFQTFYVLYGVCIFLYFEGRYQIAANHFQFPALPKSSLIFVNGLSPVFFLAFIDSILGLSHKYRNWKILIYSIYSVFAMILFLSFFNLSLATLLLFSMITLASPISVFMGYSGIKRQILASKLILVSAAIPMLGTLIHFSPNFLGDILGYYTIEWAQIAGISLEMCLFSLSIGYKIRITKDQAIESMNHAYQELQSVVYPHQVDLIKAGLPIKKTMPVGTNIAVVISFDIVRSTKIMENSRPFFTKIFRDCYEVIMEGYDPKSLESSGYRIKEMGDGFMCSVGFPFKVPGNQTNEEKAIELAGKFIRIFQHHRQVHSIGTHCSIGIATGAIEGFYPESGTQSYDLFGKGIVLATRYESMRDIIFKIRALSGDICVIQDRIFEKLNHEEQKNYEVFDLLEHGKKVRDDDEATKLYFKFHDASESLKTSA